MWVLALDVGTSSARAVGYDAAARPVAGLDASVAYEPVFTADGGAELDADHLLEAVAGTIDRCLVAAREPPAAIGASTFWHGLLLLDGAGAPLTPVFYRLGAVYELLAPLASPGHTVVATGGALARSPAWARIVADVLGRPLEISSLAEASSRGAALLAIEALGAPEPPALPPGRMVMPDGRRHAMYSAAMRRQRHLYDIIVGPRLS